MPLVSLWMCFAAVVLLSFALARQNWRHLGSGAFITRHLGLWFAMAAGLGVAFMSLPGQSLPPWLLPAAIAALTLQFALLQSQHPALRAQVQAAGLADWYAVQALRAPFGLVIVAGGLLGLLPASFAWAAGLGDVAVGIAALVLRRHAGSATGPWSPATRACAWLFTLLGAADLLNAGRLGGAVVVPWLVEQQLPGFLPIVPFFGVPIFLANHLQMARLLLRGPAHEPAAQLTGSI